MGRLKAHPISWVMRLLGIALLAVLLWRSDLSQVAQTLNTVRIPWVLLAYVLIFPLILLKVIRWREILKAQSVDFPITIALPAYFSGLFLGLLLPGRIGEFARALYVSSNRGISHSQAFASVLADRLFDLYVLIILGSIALLTFTNGIETTLTVGLIILVAVVPLLLVVNNKSFSLLKTGVRFWPYRMSKMSQNVGSWITEVREELRKLTGLKLIAALILTFAAYSLFVTQTYLIAQALYLPVSFIQVVMVTALSSLAALLPFSISGLGTREAVVVAYLGASGISAEVALGFSLLLFLVFYVGGGLVGGVVLFLKPLPLNNGAHVSKVRR